MDRSSHCSNVLLEVVIFDYDWSLVCNNDHRTDRLVILNKLKIVKLISGVCHFLEKVMCIARDRIAYFEEYLTTALFKDGVLKVRGCIVFVLGRVFFNDEVSNVSHILLKYVSLYLKSTWKRINVHYKASVVVLIEYACKEFSDVALIAASTGCCLFLEVG